ncbi:prostaglandin E synthase 3 [Elysia marginata]|uniref:Prostaglandin E synthase 3 n=1 Tax=Elysia marginata TaxID=1093978 RepID=A0AAV4GJX8_9GAST|nr:prostaglandin E synthase 3 [Elysia marginata]
MNSSSNATHLPAPPMVWAQRKDKIFLTVRLDEIRNPKIEVTEKSLHFQATAGKTNTEYDVSLEFNKDIDPQASKQQNTGREFFFMLMKKEESQGFWPRLTKDSTKLHFLKTDFDKWRDEDDSDAEDQEDFNLDEMMQSMGGLQGAGDGGALPVSRVLQFSITQIKIDLKRSVDCWLLKNIKNRCQPNYCGSGTTQYLLLKLSTV